MRTWIGLLGLALALLGLAVVADGWRPDNRIQSWTRRGEGAEVTPGACFRFTLPFAATT